MINSRNPVLVIFFFCFIISDLPLLQRKLDVYKRQDGFRFDLASILGRNEDGSPMNNPPLLRTLADDSILSNVKLIAEAWDAGGLYQVGSFPASGRWAEWNGRYRDSLRSCLLYTSISSITGLCVCPKNTASQSLDFASSATPEISMDTP